MVSLGSHICQFHFYLNIFINLFIFQKWFVFFGAEILYGIWEQFIDGNSLYYLRTNVHLFHTTEQTVSQYHCLVDCDSSWFISKQASLLIRDNKFDWIHKLYLYFIYKITWETFNQHNTLARTMYRNIGMFYSYHFIFTRGNPAIQENNVTGNSSFLWISILSSIRLHL